MPYSGSQGATSDSDQGSRRKQMACGADYGTQPRALEVGALLIRLGWLRGCAGA